MFNNDKFKDMANVLEEFMKFGLLNYINIELNKGLICIEKRPYYCDRGRFSIKVFSNDDNEFHINSAAQFPRYYFLFSNLWSELICFLNFRAVKITSISMTHGAAALAPDGVATVQYAGDNTFISFEEISKGTK